MHMVGFLDQLRGLSAEQFALDKDSAKDNSIYVRLIARLNQDNDVEFRPLLAVYYARFGIVYTDDDNAETIAAKRLGIDSDEAELIIAGSCATDYKDCTDEMIRCHQDILEALAHLPRFETTAQGLILTKPK